MECISPPALTDGQLLAYLEGDADADTATHIHQCAYCRERAQDLAQVNRQMAAQLYRAACPSPVELGEYQLRLLAAEQMSAIQQHLQVCLHCTSELQQLEGFLAQLAPALEPDPLQVMVEPVRILIARFANGIAGMTASGGASPAFAGIRGELGEQHIYEVENVQVVIEAQQDPAQADRKEILGLVLGLDNPQPLEAHLWQADQHLATGVVDELGNFVFSGLLPGAYELILSSGLLEIHIENIQL